MPLRCSPYEVFIGHTDFFFFFALPFYRLLFYFIVLYSLSFPRVVFSPAPVMTLKSKQNNDNKMKHWMFFDHISECRQLQILKTYHRPYAKEIELKLKEGVDAKDIEELQDLRDRLGLTRPKEDFIKILQICDQITSEKDETLRRAMFDVDNCPALRPDMPDPNERKKNLRDPKFLPYAFVVGEKNGKVHIGSTPKKV